MKRKKLSDIKSKTGLNDWQMWDIRLCGRHMDEVLKMVEDQTSSKPPFWIATVNPEFMMAAEADSSFKKMLGETSLNVPDGIGLVWAREVESRFKKYDIRFMNKTLIRLIVGLRVGMEILAGSHRNEVVAGADLMKKICLNSKTQNPKSKIRVFFLGGFGNRAEKTALKFKNLNSKLEIEYSPGRPSVGNDEVLRKINESEPDYLFVAYGMKKQEEWIEANLDRLKAGVVMGVGRSFDYYSGELKRAPRWVQKIGMEWLFSLFMEPKRWRRQLVLPKFVVKVLFS